MICEFIDTYNNSCFIVDVELKDNGYPPHYFIHNNTRYVRRGNKGEGHWYEYWPAEGEHKR